MLVYANMHVIYHFVDIKFLYISASIYMQPLTAVFTFHKATDFKWITWRFLSLEVFSCLAFRLINFVFFFHL